MSEMHPRNSEAEGRTFSISLILTKPSPYRNKMTLSSVYVLDPTDCSV